MAAAANEGDDEIRPVPGPTRGRVRRRSREEDEAAERDADLDGLARAAGTGDAAAMDRLLHAVRPKVLAYCRVHLRGRAALLQPPEDTAQEILLAFCSALGRYRAGDSGVLGFLYGIARNKVADAFRGAARDRTDPTDTMPEHPDPGDGPDHRAVVGDTFRAVSAALDRLPEGYREVLVLRLALRMTAAETARLTGSTPGAVRVQQHRALTRLRALLAGEPPVPG